MGGGNGEREAVFIRWQEVGERGGEYSHMYPKIRV